MSQEKNADKTAGRPGAPARAEAQPGGRRKRIYERVMERIAGLIEAGELRQGAKLPPERAMAELFRVSRSAVREAIRALSEQGLLESRHGDGTYVTAQPDDGAAAALGRAMALRRQDLEHVLQFRLLLEPQIAALAAQGATDDDVSTLAACLDAQLAGPPSRAAEADMRFHATLARATGNPLFSEVVSAVHGRLAQTREEPFQSPERERASLQAHRAILEAVAAHDPETARAAMQQHLQSVAGLLADTDFTPPGGGASPPNPKESSS